MKTRRDAIFSPGAFASPSRPSPPFTCRSVDGTRPVSAAPPRSWQEESTRETRISVGADRSTIHSFRNEWFRWSRAFPPAH